MLQHTKRKERKKEGSAPEGSRALMCIGIQGGDRAVEEIR